MMRPCIRCGEPIQSGSRCADCADPKRRVDHELSSHERGYDRMWRRLSERARRAQPWCTWCGATEGLTLDHSREAWERKAEGKDIRLEDCLVLCAPCNSRKGKAR